jgi:hypothetical protein
MFILIPALRYQVGGAGFPVAQPQSMVIPVGTIVDTSLPEWAWLANVAPPIDAIALDRAGSGNLNRAISGVSA